MNLADVHTLVAYNDWANERLMAGTAALSDVQYTTGLGGSFASIAHTVTHLVSVEWVWLRRLMREAPTAVPEWVQRGDRTEVARQLGDVAARRKAYLATLTEDALHEDVDFRYLDGRAATLTRAEIVLHLVNHSTYHRGQIANYLRQVGAVPTPTDFSNFLALQRGE